MPQRSASIARFRARRTVAERELRAARAVDMILYGTSGNTARAFPGSIPRSRPARRCSARRSRGPPRPSTA
jgi:hypothetical protein